MDFFEEEFFIASGEIPQVLQIQDYLGRNGRAAVTLFRKCRSSEQTERIWLDTFRDKIRVRLWLKRHGDPGSALAQRLWQIGERGFHLPQRESSQVFPIG